MAAAGQKGEDQALFEGVKAIGMEMCPALGIAIPVGKDSLSMRTTWNDEGEDKSVTSPMSGVITAFAPVTDVRKTLTPELKILNLYWYVSTCLKANSVWVVRSWRKCTKRLVQ